MLKEIKTSYMGKAISILLAVVLLAAMSMFTAPSKFASADPAAPTINPNPPYYVTVYVQDVNDPTIIHGPAYMEFSNLTPIDLSAQDLGYEFQRNGVNNVVTSDEAYDLNYILNTAITGLGLTPGTYWNDGSSLYVIAGGAPYTKTDKLTYEYLHPQGFFYPGAIYSDANPGVNDDGELVYAVIAKTTNSHPLTALDGTAKDWIEGLTSDDFNQFQAPRLLFGFPLDEDPDPVDLAGNRFPSNIDAITIIPPSK
jgi:hypothetical protein